MNYTKSIVVSLIASVIVVTATLAVYHPTKTIVEKNNTVQQVLKGTTPEISSQYLNVNGVIEWYYSKSNSTSDTSTSTCAFQTPSATTTLEYASLQVTQGTTTAAKWYMATSSDQYATTTNLTSLTLAAGSPGVVNYVGTAGSIFASSTYLNIVPSGNTNTAPASSSSYGTFKCQAVFLQN